MFVRRVLMLAAGVLVVVGVMSLQLIRLTVAQASQWRERAESVLTSRSFLPTVRGRILDRRGRILAEDRASYDVAVHYSLISGKWTYDRAREMAYRENRSKWIELDRPQREELVAGYLPQFKHYEDEVWEILCDLGGIDRAELHLRKTAITTRVHNIVAAVWAHRYREQNADDGDVVSMAEVAGPIGEQYETHPILRGIDAQTRLRLGAILADATDDRRSVWRQVEIVDAKTRVYPYEKITVEVDRSTLPGPLRNAKPVEVAVGGVALHVIGQMRPLWAEDDKLIKSKPFLLKVVNGTPVIDFSGYREGDRIGSWGIERSFEDLLRGKRGQRIRNRETGAEQRIEPLPGEDVALSLDIQLQARVQALMSQANDIGLMVRQDWHERDVAPGDIGRPLNGAAVVLDVSTGQVLAAVSVPGFSLDDLRDKSQDFWSSEWAQINRPRYFRPVSVAYQPGSTIKPIVLAAAYTDRKVALDATIDCEGALDMKNPVHHRCWLYKQAMVGHGPLDGPEAIMRSCNIFFYTLGQRLQAPRLVWWFDRFGLGQTTGCGLVEEFAGRLPDLRRVDEPNAPGFELSHAIQMGIGQGPVEWTPLQAANAYATLARGGFAMPPTFTIQPASSPSVVQQPRDLKLDARGMDRVMSGLDRAVNDQDGTGHHLTFDSVREPIFNLPGVKIYGKSGTATATPLRIDTDGDGRITHKDKIQLDGDHAWFVGMIKRKGSSRPDYIVVVITEYAGSGGRAAGPVANQILHAMRAEGYL